VIDKKYRLLIVLCLLIIIAGFGYYLYKNGKSAFENKLVIKYPDSCKEIYINGNLTTDKCLFINNTSKKTYDLPVLASLNITNT